MLGVSFLSVITKYLWAFQWEINNQTHFNGRKTIPKFFGVMSIGLSYLGMLLNFMEIALLIVA